MVPWFYEVFTYGNLDKPELKGIVMADDNHTAKETVEAWYFATHAGNYPTEVVIHTTIEQM